MDRPGTGESLRKFHQIALAKSDGFFFPFPPRRMVIHRLALARRNHAPKLPDDNAFIRIRLIDNGACLHMLYAKYVKTASKHHDAPRQQG
jgi:hypothetical protein